MLNFTDSLTPWCWESHDKEKSSWRGAENNCVRDGRAMGKKALWSGWHGRKPKTNEPTMLEDAIEVFTLMTLGFLFSLWGVVINIGEW